MTYASIDDYLAAQPAAARTALERVRAIVRRTLPAVEETISYGIPAFRLYGRAAIFMAGWTQHYSIYPVVPEVAAALGAKVAGYELRKGTIRFPLDAPVPALLVAAIARLLAARSRAVAEASSARSRAKTGGRAPARRATATKAPERRATTGTAAAAARTPATTAAARTRTKDTGGTAAKSRATAAGTTRTPAKRTPVGRTTAARRSRR